MAAPEFSSASSPLEGESKKLAPNDDVFPCGGICLGFLTLCQLFIVLVFCFYFTVVTFLTQMSWLKAASPCGDDVFDENADEMSVISNEWVSNMKKRVRVNAVCPSILLMTLVKSLCL